MSKEDSTLNSDSDLKTSPNSGSNLPSKAGDPFGVPFSNSRMRHTSKDHLDRLYQVILKSVFVGGLYGALISIPSELLIRWRSPLYRAFGFRIRVFYHTIWIASAAAFHAEREVIDFENVIRKEEEQKRQRLIELSVMQGLYTSDEEGFKSNKK